MKLILLCVVMIVVVLLPDEGSAVCCPTHRLNRNTLCDDCRNGTPYCGKGKCNWFGCNCKGGCRRGLCGGDDEDSRRRRSLSAYDVIRAADMDGDGRLSLEEGHAHLADAGFPALRVKRAVMEMDLNKDEFLTALEIDDNDRLF